MGHFHEVVSSMNHSDNTSSRDIGLDLHGVSGRQ
jgi:hypothetical protein